MSSHRSTQIGTDKNLTAESAEQTQSVADADIMTIDPEQFARESGERIAKLAELRSQIESLRETIGTMGRTIDRQEADKVQLRREIKALRTGFAEQISELVEPAELGNAIAKLEAWRRGAPAGRTRIWTLLSPMIYKVTCTLGEKSSIDLGDHAWVDGTGDSIATAIADAVNGWGLTPRPSAPSAVKSPPAPEGGDA